MPQTANILIVGGGIAGLTAATALAQAGFGAHLIEVKPELNDGGGIGLSIMGNASRALSAIGVAKACVDAGMPADGFTVRRADGTVTATPPWPALGGPDWPAQIGISRSVFHEILVDAATAAGAQIRCGLSIVDIEEVQHAVTVRFSNGSIEEYDLIVAADGVYSKTRSRLFPEAQGPKQTGLGIWRAYAPRPDGITTTQFYFDGPQGLVGICPISENDCYLYCLHEALPGEWRDPHTFDVQLREKLHGYGGLIPPVAEQLRDPSRISYRPLEWLLLPAPWFRGRVVIIGDAAHSNPPNLAQGAAMGIEDAVVLAQELSMAACIEDALAQFMNRRFERVRMVVETSCRIARAEAEHMPGFDAAAEMRAANAVLAQPF